MGVTTGLQRVKILDAKCLFMAFRTCRVGLTMSVDWVPDLAVARAEVRKSPEADSERGTGNALARRPIAIASRWLSLCDHAAMRARPAPGVIIDCVTDDRMDYTEASEPLHDLKAVVVHIVPLGGLDVVPRECV